MHRLAAILSVGLLTGTAWADLPAARQVLDQAEAALRSVHAVCYEARCEMEGPWGQMVPRMEGTVTLAEVPGADLPQVRVDAVVTRRDQPQPAALQVAYDGKTVTYADHFSRLYAQRDLASGANLLSSGSALMILELTLPRPFDRETMAVSLQHQGMEQIGGVDCDVIDAVYGDNTGTARWHFARTDHLPRRVRRMQTTPVGEAAITIYVLHLETNPPASDGTFRVNRPEEFREMPAPTAAQGRTFLEVGSTAPDWTLKDGEGKSVSMKELRGKVVVLDFWATWCGWCIRGFPTVQKWHEKYQGKPVAIYGVDCLERTRIDPVGFMKQRKFTYPILVSGDAAAQAFKVTGLPTMYLIGADGKILFAYSGWSEENERKVEQLIDEALKRLGDPTNSKP